MIAPHHQQQRQQEQQQGAELGQGRRQRLAVVGLAYLQLDIVGDGQETAPELGDVPHGADREGDPHKSKTGCSVSTRQRECPGRIPNDAVEEGPHADAGGRSQSQTQRQHQPAPLHGITQRLEQQQAPRQPPPPPDEHMGQQGAPEAEPDPSGGPVQTEPIGAGQGIEAIEHHQDLPHRGQQGAQQKLGVAGVDVVERSHLARYGHRLPQRPRQRLAVGHGRQHAHLAVEGAHHLGQGRVDQLGDQDELAVVEHGHPGLGALPGIPLQVIGDHHQGIDVASTQCLGALVDGVKLLRYLEPGRTIQ